MKNTYFRLTILVVGVLIIAASFRPVSKPRAVEVAAIKSISAMAFGPDGILFIGDSKSATVFAVNTKDLKQQKKPGAIEIKNIDQKIAGALGTEVRNITITDMAVNPLSKRLYISIQNSDGTPLLLKLEGEKI